MTDSVRATPSGLFDAPTLVPICPICDSDEAEPEAVVGRFEEGSRAALYLRCGVCTALYQNPTPAGSTDSEPGSSEPIADRLVRQWRVRSDANALFLLGDDVTDLGEAGPYDFVGMPLTLEASADPVGLLRAVAPHLRSPGTAIAVVSNPRSPAFKTFGGRHWNGYRFPQTRQVLPTRALEHLADRAGLRLQSTRTLFFSNVWLSSMRNLLNDWGAPQWLVPLLAGDWPLPVAAAWVLEGVSTLFGRGSLLAATMESP